MDELDAEVFADEWSWEFRKFVSTHVGVMRWVGLCGLLPGETTSWHLALDNLSVVVEATHV